MNRTEDIPDNVADPIMYVDVNSSFKKNYTHKEIEKLYYHTDHHWNYIGAHKGYEIIVEQLREDLKDFLPPLKENALLKSCVTHSNGLTADVIRYND